MIKPYCNIKHNVNQFNQDVQIMKLVFDFMREQKQEIFKVSVGEYPYESITHIHNTNSLRDYFKSLGIFIQMIDFQTYEIILS